MRVRGNRGFTILEILISIVVLVLGITGIIAIFPTAMNTGKLSVDDSYAAAIALSVSDAITSGIRNVQGTGSQWFVFNHDGVLDAPPTNASNYASGGPGGAGLHEQDYTVLLPTGGNVLIYPVPNTQDGGGGLHNSADLQQRAGGSQVDNFQTGLLRTDTEGTNFIWISRTYPLGRYRDGGPGTKGEVRDEYRVQDLNPGIAADSRLIMADNYCTYSFAFGLTRGRLSTATSVGAQQNGLYEARIMVFKNFDEAAAADLAPRSSDLQPIGGAGLALPEGNLPIHTFVTMMNP